MHVLVFGASNSKNSINAKLARYAAERFKANFVTDARLEFLDLNDFEMPIYSIDREKETGIPQAAQDFYAKIGAADALIISYAEYNGLYTSAWKNIFDWMSRIKQSIFQDKPMVILAATPGGRGGQGVLQTAQGGAPYFGADIKGVHGVGKWPSAYDDENNTLVNQDDITAIDAALAALVP